MLRPVCGSDGHLYINPAMFKCAVKEAIAEGRGMLINVLILFISHSFN